MTILQLNPPIWVQTPLGEGWALMIIDYGVDWNTCWVVGLHKGGKVKHFDANDIRICENHTYDIERPETPLEDLDKSLKKGIKQCDKIMVSFKQITGFDTHEEMSAYEKGREHEQKVMMQNIEKWDGKGNSAFGTAMRKKFIQLRRKKL